MLSRTSAAVLPLILDEAACAAPGAPDPFPNGLIGLARVAHIVAAAEVCASCPGLQACLAYAERTQPTDGVWGGRWWGDTGTQRAGVPGHLLARSEQEEAA